MLWPSSMVEVTMVTALAAGLGEMNERSIFSSSTGSTVQLRQRRMPGAEVIDREAYAGDRAAAACCAPPACGSLHHRALGDLQQQRAGLHAVLRAAAPGSHRPGPGRECPEPTGSPPRRFPGPRRRHSPIWRMAARQHPVRERGASRRCARPAARTPPVRRRRAADAVQRTSASRLRTERVAIVDLRLIHQRQLIADRWRRADR